MKAIRIEAYQNHANYKKEETSQNKMTYPLPPFSTVIGAIHNACRWENYHDMKVGILGNFSSLENRIYRDNIYLDNTKDDRGVLVKCVNNNLLTSSNEIVAIAKKRNCSFKKNIDIEILNKNLYDEWLNIDKQIENLKTEYKRIIYPISKRLEEIKNQKSKLDKKSDEFSHLMEEDKKLKKEKDAIQKEQKEKEKKLLDKKSLFKTMNPSIRNMELLTQVNLIIYIIPDNDEDIDEILKNINKIVSIGRADDYVEIIDAKLIELESLSNEKDYENNDNYCQYVDYDLIKRKKIGRDVQGKQKQEVGTVYYIPKNYSIIDNKRVFNRQKVVLVSGIYADSTIDNVFYDKEKQKIINLF